MSQNQNEKQLLPSVPMVLRRSPELEVEEEVDMTRLQGSVEAVEAVEAVEVTSEPG